MMHKYCCFIVCIIGISAGALADEEKPTTKPEEKKANVVSTKQAYDFDSMFSKAKKSAEPDDNAIDISEFEKDTEEEFSKVESEYYYKHEYVAPSSSNSASSSSSSSDYVMVEFESVCGLLPCSDKNLTMAGGSGTFESSFSGARTGTIYKGYNGLAGEYRWQAKVDNQICGGTVTVSGSRSNLFIKVYKDCRDAGTREF